MTVYRVTFRGPGALALQTASALADADGVDLISSQPPATVGDSVELELQVDGSSEVVADAIDRIRRGLPSDATIAIVEI